MVDAVVSFVVERLGDYLIQEAKFLRGVKDEVESLTKELQWMKSFVKDAEANQAGNDLIRQWVSDIRDIAYDAEDVLDKYILSVHDDKEGASLDSPMVDGEGTSRKKQGLLAFKDRFSKFVKGSSHKESNLYSSVKEEVTVYNIGKEIEAIKKRLGDVDRRCKLYGLNNIISDNRDVEKLKQLRRATSFADEENPVGLEDDTLSLLDQLFDKQPRRLVISIYGMGGLGKTTLAKKLYHNSEVKCRFDCFAWVSVSQDYERKDLLLRIIKSFNFKTASEDLETEEDLGRYLHKSLQGHSYLMVLDDIWDKEGWSSLKSAFPENMNGSRVIITTRNRGVAERSDDHTCVHELRFLRPEESWQLFCKKAFRNSIPQKGLENLGREMVEKCRGLPLAIVVLGGLLYAKKPQEWGLVRAHLWRHVRSDSIEVAHLLDLSFNDLSPELKLCFLYLGLFPEDFIIDVEKLIRLLVAEGFAKQTDDQIMEDVARDHLDELINRSLIQTEKRRWGRVSTCRVHDLLRELAIDKAKDLNFIHFCDESKSPNPSSVMSSCRRQAIYSDTSSNLWLHHSNPLSRSLLLFSQRWVVKREAVEPKLSPMFTRFSVLRVLDAGPVDTLTTGIISGGELSEKIGKLIHLRYLSLRDSNITKFPRSIRNLQRLQTLDLSGGGMGLEMKLPDEIDEIQELRHLIGNFVGNLPIENLSNLQTLKSAKFESWEKVNTAKLVNLRELHIEAEEWTGDNKVFSFQSIAKLRSLQFLSVYLLDVNSFASLQPLSQCIDLVDLRLSGRMKKLPEDMHMFLPKLGCLSLAVSYLEEDPMPALERLPNLMILDLHIKCHYLKKFCCRAEGFPLLGILQLDANGIEEFEVEEEAMPMLRGLKILQEIPNLKIPERLRSIPPPAEWECEDL